MRLTNEYSITVGDRHYEFTNLVTNYGVSKLLAGVIYPAQVALGSGTGIPSKENNTIFTHVGTVSMSRSISVDINTSRVTVTLSALLDESTYAGRDFTEIGIGDRTTLYTHALFTDSLGEPITIHKGVLERMTIKVVAYLDFPEADSIGIYRLMRALSLGRATMHNKTRGAFCLTQNTEQGVLPLLINRQAERAATASGGNAVIDAELKTTEGSGVLNSYCAYQLAPLSEATYNFAVQEVAFFENARRAKETIGAGDAIITEYSLPYKTVNPDEIKVFINDELVPKAEYNIELVSKTNYTSRFSLVPANASLRKFYFTSISSNIYKVHAMDFCTWVVELNEDETLKSIYPEYWDYSNSYVEGFGYDRTMWLHGSTKHIVQMYETYSQRTHVYMSDYGKHFSKIYEQYGYNLRALLLENINNPKDITCQYGRYILSDTGIETLPAIPTHFSKYMDMQKAYRDGTLVQFRGESTKTYIDTYTADFTKSTETIEHPALTYNNRIVDTHNNIIYSAQDYTVYVYFMSADYSEILNTVKLSSSNKLTEMFMHHAGYVVFETGATNKEDFGGIAIDREEMTAVFDFSLSRSKFKPLTIEGWDYHIKAADAGVNDCTVSVPDTYKLVFNAAPEAEASIKVEYSNSSIEKSTDWMLEADMTFGYVE